MWLKDKILLLIIIITNFIAPSGPPTNFVASSSDSRSISLTWNQPEADELNGILRHYLVTLTSILPTETQNISSSQVYITITGLRPNTQYTCIVSTETVGSGPPTPAQQILTPEDGILNMKLRTYPYCPQ